MDRTEIGSVAEITAPNQKQSFRVNIPEMSAIALVRPYIIPLKQNKIINRCLLIAHLLCEYLIVAKLGVVNLYLKVIKL
jgi:hypothetical protein